MLTALAIWALVSMLGIVLGCLTVAVKVLRGWRARAVFVPLALVGVAFAPLILIAVQMGDVRKAIHRWKVEREIRRHVEQFQEAIRTAKMGSVRR